MNDAYLHLIINHVPIFSTLFGLLILAWGLFKKSSSIQNIAMVLFIVGAVSSYLAVESGEGAEEIVEDYNTQVSHDTIHNHEEAAEVTLWFSIITGALSVLALFSNFNNKRITNALMGVILVAALSTFVSLSYTAYEGGKINHPEAHDTIIVEQHSDDD
jgi:uncharacterized membrane protein